MLQGGEILIIALLALIVLGPKRLPELFRRAGQLTTELRAAARDMSKGLESEVEDLKAVGKDLKAVGEELKEPLREVKRGLEEAVPSVHEWTGPKPVSGPTPEDAMADLEKIEGDAEPNPPDEASE